MAKMEAVILEAVGPHASSGDQGLETSLVVVVSL
jgi:hypothetical protein